MCEDERPHIALVGMSGVGKTVIGRELASWLGWGFEDIDEWLEEKVGNRQNFLDTHGEEEYVLLEYQTMNALLLALAALYPARAVIATSGSIIYPVSKNGPSAIQELKKLCSIIYLTDETKRIVERRKGTASKQGIVGMNKDKPPDVALRELTDARHAAYQMYADYVVDLARIPDSWSKDFRKTTSFVATDLLHFGILQSAEFQNEG